MSIERVTFWMVVRVGGMSQVLNQLYTVCQRNGLEDDKPLHWGLMTCKDRLSDSKVIYEALIW
jgi:hypothetical protein